MRLNNMVYSWFTKKNIITGALTLVFFGLLSMINPVSAAEPELETEGSEKIYLVNPIGGISDGTNEQKIGQVNLTVIIGSVIKKMLGVLGAGALLVFVYGGFLWVTAAGNSDKISTGASAMTWAAIGVCIIFSSYAIINLVLKTLTSGAVPEDATGADGAPNYGAVGKKCYCFADGETELSWVKKYDDKEAACKAITGDKVGVSDFNGEVKNCQWK